MWGKNTFEKKFKLINKLRTDLVRKEKKMIVFFFLKKMENYQGVSVGWKRKATFT